MQDPVVASDHSNENLHDCMHRKHSVPTRPLLNACFEMPASRTSIVNGRLPVPYLGVVGAQIATPVMLNRAEAAAGAL
jgi:hypothetical protein